MDCPNLGRGRESQAQDGERWVGGLWMETEKEGQTVGVNVLNGGGRLKNEGKKKDF